MDLKSIEEAISLAQERWPSTLWHIKTNEEASSPCPWCGGTKRFLLWISGYYICRPGDGQCGREGWLDEEKRPNWTPEERRLRRIEAEQARQRRKIEQQETRIQALERMAQCTDHEGYHKSLLYDPDAVNWCVEQGLEMPAIIDYKVGLCQRCPTDREGRPSYTFPIWRKDGPLWSIRHRLVGPDHGGKYRPHRKNLGRQLVNARHLADWPDWVLCVEGTKKARVIQQYDIPVIGILGKTGFEDRWLSWFHPSAAIYIALDPDATENAERLGHGIAKTGKEVYVARLPDKPDDMVVQSGDVGELEHYIKLARRVH